MSTATATTATAEVRLHALARTIRLANEFGRPVNFTRFDCGPTRTKFVCRVCGETVDTATSADFSVDYVTEAGHRCF